MANKKWTDDYFSKAVRAERERRGWSQGDMAKALADKKIHVHWTTIAKIEKGDRSVRIDEAAAIADVFDLSVDALLGRKTARENALAYTLRGALDASQQCSWQVSAMQTTLSERFSELQSLDFAGVEELLAEADAAQRALKMASESLGRIGAFRMAASAGIKLQFDSSGAMANEGIRQVMSQLVQQEEDSEAES